MATRSLAPVRIRPIGPDDASAVAEILRGVRAEHAMDEQGAPLLEPDELDLHATSQRPGCGYWVAEQGGLVLGGAGISPLEGVSETCELQRMYLLPPARGLGLGRRLVQACLRGARKRGYSACYAESMGFMAAARRLYESAGFEPLDGPLGTTGHEFPTAWYLLRF